MLSLTEIQDLLAVVERGSEGRKALEKFITGMRGYFAGQMAVYLRQSNQDEAMKYAHFDEAYEDFMAHLEQYAQNAHKQV